MEKKTKRRGEESLRLGVAKTNPVMVPPERLAEINSRGLKILMGELGPEDFILFMAQNFSGKGDYSRDRHKLLPKMTLAELATEMETRRTNAARRS